MNLIDVIIIIIFIGCLIISLARGFTVSVFGLAGIFFGLIIAEEYYSIIGKILGMIISPKAANIIGYLIICLFIMLLAAHIGLSFKKRIVSVAFFRLLDRIGGLLFGLVMGVIIWELFQMVLLNYTHFNVGEAIQHSRITMFLSYQISDYAKQIEQFALSVIQQFP